MLCQYGCTVDEAARYEDASAVEGQITDPTGVLQKRWLSTELNVESGTSWGYLSPEPGIGWGYLTPEPGTGWGYLPPEPGTGWGYLTSEPGIGWGYLSPEPGTGWGYLTLEPGTVWEMVGLPATRARGWQEVRGATCHQSLGLPGRWWGYLPPEPGTAWGYLPPVSSSRCLSFHRVARSPPT